MRRRSKYISYILLILSAFLYCYSPSYYDWDYCSLSLLLYVCNILLFFTSVDVKRDYFHILLFISFFCCNYVYATFVYPINPAYFKIFALMSDDTYISKAVALSTLGASSYICGYISTYANKKFCMKLEQVSVIKKIGLLKILTILLFILFLFTAGPGFLLGEFDSISNIGGYFLLLFKVFFYNYIIFSFYTKRKFLKERTFAFILRLDKSLLCLIVVYIAFFLRAGERGEAIQLILLLFCLYNLYVTQFAIKKFVISVCLAVIVLNIIMQNRGNNNPITDNPYRNEGSVSPIIDAGMDLIIISFPAFEAQKYVDEKGHTYGLSAVGFILSAFPFSQSIIYPLLDFDAESSTSARLLTKNLGNRLGRDLTFGIGTNLIGDLYLSFGSFILVIILFFCGRKVYLLQYKVMYLNSLFDIVTFCICFMYVVYLPRTSIFALFQMYLWSYIVSLFFVKKEILTQKKYHSCVKEG